MLREETFNVDFRDAGGDSQCCGYHEGKSSDFGLLVNWTKTQLQQFDGDNTVMYKYLPVIDKFTTAEVGVNSQEKIVNEY